MLFCYGYYMLELIAMFFFYLSYKLDLLSNIYHIQHKESSGNIITALYSFCDLKIKTESWTRITACWQIKFLRTCIKHISILLEILLADIIMTVQIDIEMNIAYIFFTLGSGRVWLSSYLWKSNSEEKCRTVQYLYIRIYNMTRHKIYWLSQCHNH